MNAVAICSRSVYLITYSQADTAEVPSLREISEIVFNAFSKTKKAKLSRSRIQYILLIKKSSMEDLHIVGNAL